MILAVAVGHLSQLQIQPPKHYITIRIIKESSINVYFIKIVYIMTFDTTVVNNNNIFNYIIIIYILIIYT